MLAHGRLREVASAAENEPLAATSRSTFILRMSSISRLSPCQAGLLGLMETVCLAGGMSRRSLVLLLSAFLGCVLPVHQGCAGRRRVALGDRLHPHCACRAVLVPLAAQMGVLESPRARSARSVVLAFVQVAVPLTLIGLGEERISSRCSQGDIVATAPIFTFLLAFTLTGEPSEHGEPRGCRDIVGVRGGCRRRGEALVGGMFIILAAFGYACRVVTKRNLAGVELVATVAGTAWPRVPFRSGCFTCRRPPGFDALTSLLTLGVVCTGSRL